MSETEDAILHGADEIDMVINIGDLKEENHEAIKKEIQAVKRACGGRILKIIIETCLLSEAEKITMCQIVTEAGATFEDIRLFAAHIGEGVQIKAAGGIGSEEDAKTFLSLGATRLGTSQIVKLANQECAGMDFY